MSIKTLAGEWAALVENLDPAFPKDVLAELKRAYYVGAYKAFGITVQLQMTQDVQQVETGMEKLEDEIALFFAEQKVLDGERNGLH